MDNHAACSMHYYLMWSYLKQTLKWHKSFQKPRNTNPKENVFGWVKASCVNTGSVRGVSLTHHPASKAWDGAGSNRVLALFWSSWCICHHKVYGALSGTANLKTRKKIMWFMTHSQAFIKCYISISVHCTPWHLHFVIIWKLWWLTDYQILFRHFITEMLLRQFQTVLKVYFTCS